MRRVSVIEGRFGIVVLHFHGGGRDYIRKRQQSIGWEDPAELSHFTATRQSSQQKPWDRVLAKPVVGRGGDRFEQL